MMNWNGKLFMYLFFFIFFFCGKGCVSINISHSSSVQVAYPESEGGDRGNITCRFPYHPVGEHCLLIDNDIRGTWNEVRDVCLAIGGDLVNLQDANILYDISNYIQSKGMTDVSYWVGATDEAEEGKWLWTSENSDVKGGTPIWGALYGHQPDGAEDQNCAALYDREYYYMHDDLCNGMKYGFICQPTASEELMPMGDLEKGNILNPSSNDCPYEMIGNACLSIDVQQIYNWTEARDSCLPDKHIVKIDDANFLGAIYDYLTEKKINSYLWIGGTDGASEDDWVWHDGTPVKRGTPYWGANSDLSQEPNGGASDNCSYIWFGRSYFFRDIACYEIQGVICQYDM